MCLKLFCIAKIPGHENNSTKIVGKQSSKRHCIGTLLAQKNIYIFIYLWMSSRGVVVKVLDCDIGVSKF